MHDDGIVNTERRDSNIMLKHHTIVFVVGYIRKFVARGLEVGVVWQELPI